MVDCTLGLTRTLLAFSILIVLRRFILPRHCVILYRQQSSRQDSVIPSPEKVRNGGYLHTVSSHHDRFTNFLQVIDCLAGIQKS